MKLPISGRCLCGAISYEISKQPKRTGFCYCRSCQIKSGSDHVAYLAVEIESINISGAIKWYQSIGDSGKTKQHGFCPECGSVLFGKPKLWPLIFVV
ncbi:MAG: GFA family protein, partial [Gammaproteobacteria bacterium]|nr:GFA family protein [Gammaproteobacteria bacterium]